MSPRSENGLSLAAAAVRFLGVWLLVQTVLESAEAYALSSPVDWREFAIVGGLVCALVVGAPVLGRWFLPRASRERDVVPSAEVGGMAYSVLGVWVLAGGVVQAASICALDRTRALERLPLVAVSLVVGFVLFLGGRGLSSALGRLRVLGLEAVAKPRVAPSTLQALAFSVLALWLIASGCAELAGRARLLLSVMDPGARLAPDWHHFLTGAAELAMGVALFLFSSKVARLWRRLQQPLVTAVAREESHANAS